MGAAPPGDEGEGGTGGGTAPGRNGDAIGPGFRVLGERRVFEARVFSVSRLELTDPDGHRFEREVVRHPGAVAVVAVGDDGAATVVRQLRTPLGATIVEVPAGTCDVEGEDLESTARRELAEETGIRARRWECLGAFYNSPGYSDQLTTLYLATDLEDHSADAERAGPEERWMSVERLALDHVEALVSSGRLRDGTTVIGLLLARAALAERGGHHHQDAARADERG